MSEATTLQAVLKGAADVASLASTDRLLAIDANGNPKKISRIQASTPTVSSGDVDKAQWIRIGSFASGGNLLLSITSQWSNSPGLHLLVDMILHPHSSSYNNATVLSRLTNTGTSVLSKLRVVRKTNAVCYIDIYYNANVRNSFLVRVLDSSVFTLLPSMEFNAEIPDGYTVREFDLSNTSWGGVNGYLSTVYNPKQKGGQRHERGEDTGCRHRQGAAPRRHDDRTGTGHQPRRAHHHRNLPGNRQPRCHPDRSAARSLPLRQPRGLRRTILRGAGVLPTHAEGRIRPVSQGDACRLPVMDSMVWYPRHLAVKLAGKEVAA